MTTMNDPDADRLRWMTIMTEKARAHLTVVAAGLREVLGGADQAGAVMMGAALGLLEEAGGKEYAVKFLLEMAAALEAGDDAADQAKPPAKLN